MNYWKPAAVAVCCAFVIACGSESGAPAGSAIDLQPPEKVWATAATTSADPLSFVDQPVLVTVRGPNGAPVNNVDITISLDLAPGTVPLGDEVMFIFEDENPRDGVPDTGPYSGPVPPSITDMAVGALALPYQTSVGEFGSKQFIVRMALFGGILFYKGTLNVGSGSSYGFATFEVTCEDSATITCP
jgi:hypothetical protein